MKTNAQEHSDERAELHFLAALLEELMRALHTNGLMTRDELQAIENAVHDRTGVSPRAW
ncbi:hypothetical protein [Croceicoccus ponticola]|uniref:hypothetical protein n=1 Tax=Croceicoccus ponticola TaxID=2217664 RepID=UPI0013E2D584|nr:hypothetical protein [Croceicoccus ponticola]